MTSQPSLYSNIVSDISTNIMCKCNTNFIEIESEDKYKFYLLHVLWNFQLQSRCILLYVSEEAWLLLLHQGCSLFASSYTRHSVLLQYW
jgi:hypothetical protein